MRALPALCGILFARLLLADTNTLDWAAVSLAMEVGDYAAAEARVGHVAAGDATATATLGLIHTKRREYPEAEAAFREAMRLEPANGLHAWNLGEFLYLTGQWAHAVEAYDLVPERLPQRPFAEYKAILALLRADQRAAAWERISVLRMREEDPLFLFAHAAWHASDGRLEEGLWFARGAASIYQAEGVLLFLQPLRDAGWMPADPDLR
jgi:tetratricopeptide (TPR) repeat protein